MKTIDELLKEIKSHGTPTPRQIVELLKRLQYLEERIELLENFQREYNEAHQQ